MQDKLLVSQKLACSQPPLCWGLSLAAAGVRSVVLMGDGHWGGIELTLVCAGMSLPRVLA